MKGHTVEQHEGSGIMRPSARARGWAGIPALHAWEQLWVMAAKQPESSLSRRGVSPPLRARAHARCLEKPVASIRTPYARDVCGNPVTIRN